MKILSRILTFGAAALRAGDDPSSTEAVDDLIRERLATMTLPEAIAIARVTALRDGERDLAAALQAVLLLHLTGGSLAPIVAMATPEPTQDVVN